MSQHYSNPARARDPHALPDIEVFYLDEAEAKHNARHNREHDDGSQELPGWYWWACFPGCLPDGDGTAHGPYASEAEAIAAATDDGIESDEPWDTDGQLGNENGESSEAENDAHARRNYRD